MSGSCADVDSGARWRKVWLGGKLCLLNASISRLRLYLRHFQVINNIRIKQKTSMKSESHIRCQFEEEAPEVGARPGARG